MTILESEIALSFDALCPLSLSTHTHTCTHTRIGADISEDVLMTILESEVALSFDALWRAGVMDPSSRCVRVSACDCAAPPSMRFAHMYNCVPA